LIPSTDSDYFMSKGLPTGFTGCTDGGTSIFHWGQGEINRIQVIWLLGNMYLDNILLKKGRLWIRKAEKYFFFINSSVIIKTQQNKINAVGTLY